jgi:hypothetical protein
MMRMDPFDDTKMDEVWARVEAGVRARAEAALIKAQADLEATGMPVGEDADSIDRALAAALAAVPTGNEQEQPA